MNISYTKKGDYLLPNLILKDKEQFNIGKYGLLRLEIEYWHGKPTLSKEATIEEQEEMERILESFKAKE